MTPLIANPPPPLPPLVTWNPSSLATIHTTPSPKLSHIMKLARRHICHIQETQWSSHQYQHIQLQAPNCHIFHTPAVEGFSSGVASFLPKHYFSDKHAIVVPGFILSVSVTIQQFQVEYINVYLHPSKVRSLGQSLLTHLQTTTSRSHALRMVGGDFNHIQKSSTSLFQDILQELDCPFPSLVPTYRKHDGYTSCLDFFLVQSCSSLSPPSSSSLTFWPSYQPVGHGIHIYKFSKPPLVLVLTTSLLPRFPHLLFTSLPLFASPPPHSSLMIFDHSLGRCWGFSLLPYWISRPNFGPGGASTSPYRYLLKPMLTILTFSKRSFLILKVTSLLSLVSHGNGFSNTSLIPPILPFLLRIITSWFLMSLSQLLTQYDAQHSSQTRPQPRTQFSTPPTHTWHKCRIAGPKTSPHHGIVRSSSGTLCTTTATLDHALRATRQFWQQWDTLLSTYTTECSPFPICPPPPTLPFIIQLSLPRTQLLVQMVFLTLLGASAHILLSKLFKTNFRAYFLGPLRPLCNPLFLSLKLIRVNMRTASAR